MHHQNVEEFRISTPPTDEEIAEAVHKAKQADVVIFGTMNAHLFDKQAEMVNKVCETGKPVIAIALRNPYDLMVIPKVNALIANYEFTLPSLTAATDVLFGVTKATGKLPVTIPGHAAIGFGITD